MIIQGQPKESFRVIGYFSYNSGTAFCDGDACIIAGSEELMRSYLNGIPKSNGRDVIKKTRFGEIINGMMKGGAYAFDKKSYERFYRIATINGIADLPSKDVFLEHLDEEMHLIRIQLSGL